MKKYILLLLWLPMMAVAGENGGVKATNAAVSGAYSGGSGSGIAASGTLRMPLADYFGLGVTAGVGAFQPDGNAVDSVSSNLGASLFVSDYDIGRLSLAVGYGETRFDAPAGFDIDPLQQTSIAIGGEYFFEDITLLLSRETIDTDGFGELHVASAAAHWYLDSNTRLGLSIGGLDASDSYGVSVQHQPNWFQERAAVGFAYANADDNDSYSVSISYFFDTLIPLLERDRKY